MGISPDIWGPGTWAFLHLIVLSEPETLDTNRLIYYKNLYVLLQELLPCQKCRNHLKENMGKLKDITTLRSKRELFDWTTQLHNLVNKITNKKSYDTEEAYKLWKEIAEGKRNLQNIRCAPVWKYRLVCMIVVLLIVIYFTSLSFR